MRKKKGPKKGGPAALLRGLGPWLAGAAAFFAFLPALRNKFVNWDDPVNFLANLSYRGLGWENLKWMWTTPHMNHYIPVTWMTLGLDFAFWGMNPAGYHLTSLLWHAGASVLFFFVARKLLRRTVPGDSAGLELGTLLAALLFAVHPLRAESAVWITERRDLVSGVFVFATVLCHMRGRYRLSLGFFALALLSKETTAVLAAGLLILDVYPLRRLGGSAGWTGPAARRVLWEKVPFFALGAAAGAAMVAATPSVGGDPTLQYYSPSLRLAQSFYSLFFHAQKTLFPAGLSPVYLLRDDLTFWEGPILLRAAAVLAAAGALIALRKRWPAGLAAGAWYAAALAPSLGIAVGVSLTYDRHSYLACAGWALLAGAGFRALWDRGRARPALAAGAAALLVLLTGLSWNQAKVWRDSETLWRHALAVDPANAIAQNNLGIVLGERGDLDGAVAHYQEALRIRPRYVSARFNWGVALSQMGRHEEAVDMYRRILREAPRYAQVHNNLASTLYLLGRTPEALPHFEEALRQVPRYAEAHNNYGAALASLGRREEAAAHFEEALRLRPDYPQAHQNLERLRSGGPQN